MLFYNGSGMEKMKKNRARFMRNNFGLMTHWLYGPVDSNPKDGILNELVIEWNAKVDAFDTERLASQIASTQAKWFILTIGQNSGFYCSPNEIYDNISGYSLSKCSKRDLFKDIAVALKKHNIPILAYLPSGAPDKDIQAMEQFEWTDLSLRGKNGEILRNANGFRQYEKTECTRLAGFQKKWEKVIRRWAEEWGDLCAGWWIDGVYFANAMYNFNEEPNFNSFAKALRSGNPDAAICFNPGIIRIDYPYIQSEEEDFSAGELSNYLYSPFGRKNIPDDFSDGYIGSAQLHLLNYLGGNWGQGPMPRFPDTLICAWTKYILDNKGSVTWDIPTDKNGEINNAFMPSIIELGKKIYG